MLNARYGASGINLLLTQSKRDMGIMVILLVDDDEQMAANEHGNPGPFQSPLMPRNVGSLMLLTGFIYPMFSNGRGRKGDRSSVQKPR